MAWVKLDDQFFRNPKIVAAGRDARDLYMASLCYSASALTDGVIANSVLRILGAEADIDDAKGAAGRLVECGLWDLDEKGFRVHDYHDYNPTAEKVLAERSAAQERMRRARSGEVRPNNGEGSANPVPVPRPVPNPVVKPRTEGLSSESNAPAGAPARDDPEQTESKTKRRSKLPDDWMPSGKQREALGEQGYSAAEIDTELVKFTNHHAHKGDVGLDWPRAFTNWMIRSREFAAPRSAANGHAPPGRNMTLVNGQRNLSSADLRRRALGETLDESA